MRIRALASGILFEVRPEHWRAHAEQQRSATGEIGDGERSPREAERERECKRPHCRGRAAGGVLGFEGLTIRVKNSQRSGEELGWDTMGLGPALIALEKSRFSVRQLLSLCCLCLANASVRVKRRHHVAPHQTFSSMRGTPLCLSP